MMSLRAQRHGGGGGGFGFGTGLILGAVAEPLLSYPFYRRDQDLRDLETLYLASQLRSSTPEVNVTVNGVAQGLHLSPAQGYLARKRAQAAEGEVLQDLGLTRRDKDAVARVFASENENAPDDVKVEQAWSQWRARAPHESLYHRITGGRGYGPQGGSRPVSTAKEPRPEDVDLAERFAAGELPSELPGARKFFEPRQQDLVYRQVQAGKKRLAAGLPVSERTKRLIDQGYEKDADTVRQGWAQEGSQLVGTVGPLEFWT